MATLEQCHDAVQLLATRLSAWGDKPQTMKDRTMSCHVTDLAVTFSGVLRSGEIVGLTTDAAPKAQIGLRMSSDDLVALTHGGLHAGHAFTTGRLKVDASLMDLIRLKRMF